MKVNLLKAEFVKNGLTQIEVAKRLNMSEGTLIRKLKNDDMKVKEANALVELLHIENPNEIFFG